MTPNSTDRLMAGRFDHIGLVVADKLRAEEFYAGFLKLPRHQVMDSWFWLNTETAIHLIEIPESKDEPSLYHHLNHAAIEVEDLRQPQQLLLLAGKVPFQMDDEGNIRDAKDLGDRLEFGIGTLFSKDRDDNLVEFVQLGHGLFTPENALIDETSLEGLNERAIQFGPINHICQIVKGRDSAQEFWHGALGLSHDTRDPDGDWFKLESSTSIHTAPAEEAETDPTYYRRNHFAVEVPSTEQALRLMLDGKQSVSWFDAECAFVQVNKPSDVVGSTRPSFFVADPDGNLIEFGERGKGEF